MIVLVLGGTRSGKSAIAEGLVATFDPPVTYVATAVVDRDDPDHVHRVERHRARRPPGWTTVECDGPADLPRHLAATTTAVLVDSLGTWVAGHPELVIDTEALLASIVVRDAPTVLVSEEVGLAVHPPTELGRRFVDVVGELNQAVAAVADRVLLVVAGRAVDLPATIAGQP